MNKELILGFGRLSRLRFLAYLNSWFLLVFTPTVAALFLAELTDLQTIGLVLTATIVFNLVSLKFVAQRYRDVGVHGSWSLIFLIPLASPLLYLLLALIPGDQAPNRYGPQNPSPSLWLLIPALLPIVLLFEYWLSLYTGLAAAVPFIMAA